MDQLGDPGNSSDYCGPDVSFLHVRVSALQRTNARLGECISDPNPVRFQTKGWCLKRKNQLFQKTEQFFSAVHFS